MELRAGDNVLINGSIDRDLPPKSDHPWMWDFLVSGYFSGKSSGSVKNLPHFGFGGGPGHFIRLPRRRLRRVIQ